MEYSSLRPGDFVVSRGGEYPICAVRVVHAVSDDILSPLHKLLWSHIFDLSRRPEGCTATAGSLARRLGVALRTAETLRWELEQYGLLRRPNCRRAWYVTLPADCIPGTPRPTDAQVIECAEGLEHFLRPAVERRLARYKADHKPGSRRGLHVNPLGQTTATKQMNHGARRRETRRLTEPISVSAGVHKTMDLRRLPGTPWLASQSAHARGLAGWKVEKLKEKVKKVKPFPLPPRKEESSLAQRTKV